VQPIVGQLSTLNRLFLNYTWIADTHRQYMEVKNMVQTVIETTIPAAEKNPSSPYAPADWSLEMAVEMAEAEGLNLTEEHVKVLLDLQEYFAKHEEPINLQELHEALEEEYHIDGGIKHLYMLFPGGPITQGCRLAGLKVPAYAKDESFGSVM
jgi:tRNA 2-thiouridine synthesizing protein E